MHAEFSIDLDRRSHLFHVTLAGFFNTADIERFNVAVNAALDEVRRTNNTHFALVDVREMRIQSQDVVAGFQAVLSNPTVVARRLAFVVKKSLSRVQLQRAAAARNARYFASVAEARVWLPDSDPIPE